MPQEIAATLSRSTLAFTMLRAFIQLMQSASATQAPVMDAVRVPPSACSTSQSTVIWRSPSASRSTTARRLRPISRWISTVRPFCLPAEASRRVRSSVARGSMPYSAVIQPRAWPFSQGGSRSSSVAVTRTWVSPNFTKQDPSAYLTTPRSSETARNSSGCRRLGRMQISRLPNEASFRRSAVISAMAPNATMPQARCGTGCLAARSAVTLVLESGRLAPVMEATQAIATFAATLTHDDLPPSVRDHCKNLLLDALACAVAGRRGEETPQVAAFAAALAQGAQSSVIGGGYLSLAGATLLNAYLVTATTMCDVHRATMTHITPEVVPPALMIAERDGLSGRALLVAIAAGCEVTTRIGISLDYPAFRARGWHGPGIIGPFGAAAAVGSLLRFDADTMARAFGLAGSQAAGTYAAWGTPTVKFHQCRGALSGLLAALLAQQNFVATREFLTAKDGGLYHSYANGGLPGLAVAELGKRSEERRVGKEC